MLNDAKASSCETRLLWSVLAPLTSHREHGREVDRDQLRDDNLADPSMWKTNVALLDYGSLNTVIWSHMTRCVRPTESRRSEGMLC